MTCRDLPDLRQGRPRNLGWRGLEDADRLVAALAGRVDLDRGDMDAAMRASRRLKDAPEGPAGPGPVPAAMVSRAAACEWVRGAEARWRAWIPPVCPPGSAADSALTR